MYAIIQKGSHQHKVQLGAFLRVEKQPEEQGSLCTTTQILALSHDGQLTVGDPYVKGASLGFRVIRHGKSKKKLVFKKNRRKGYRRTKGHRQEFTEIYIESLKTLSGQTETKPLKKSTAPTTQGENKEEA